MGASVGKKREQMNTITLDDLTGKLLETWDDVTITARKGNYTVLVTRLNGDSPPSCLEDAVINTETRIESAKTIDEIANRFWGDGGGK